MKLASGNYIRSPRRYSWWLRQGRYLRYMVRELSSLFIGLFSILMIWGLYSLSQGKVAFDAFASMLWGPGFVFLSSITFIFAAYHSYTWFIVTPKAMPIKVGGKRLSPVVIIGAHMFLWLLCSVIIWVVFVYGGGV